MAGYLVWSIARYILAVTYIGMHVSMSLWVPVLWSYVADYFELETSHDSFSFQNILFGILGFTLNSLSLHINPKFQIKKILVNCALAIGS